MPEDPRNPKKPDKPDQTPKPKDKDDGSEPDAGGSRPPQ